MSQYTFYKEVPTTVFRQLLLSATDYNHHEKVMDSWLLSIDENFVIHEPGTGLYSMSPKPYRVLSGGKYGVDWPIPEKESRFFRLLSQHEQWKSINKIDPSLNGGGTPGIMGFRSADQLKAIWSVIDITIINYPEYKIDDMFLEDSRGDDPGSLNDYIRYHYGCAVRNSADIQVAC